VSWAARWAVRLAGLIVLLHVGSADAGPPPIDPRQMSGVPRVDPQLPAGSLTVRCLIGAFDRPAQGVEVVLELEGPDGARERRQATTAEAGRATFSELGPFAGWTAVASATLGGDEVRSQPIPIDARAGSRVMLVGASGDAPEAPPAADGAHGGAEIPLPGHPFPLDNRPPGQIVAGALDLDAGRPLAGIEIVLEARRPGAAPDAEPLLRSQTSNADGRVVFEGLVPPEFPAGTQFVVRAVLAAGEDPQRSVEFELEQRSVAVVLAKGHAPSTAPSLPLRERRPLAPPRADPSLAAGTVRVRVVDGEDRPVADQVVSVVKKDMSGDEEQLVGRTGPDGVATVTDVPVRSDSFYFAGAIHDDGPYQSGFFQLPDTHGASVELRVFPTTADRSRIKSAVHYEIRPLENDAVQIIRVYEVLVEGAEAYWPRGGLRLHAAPGARFVKPLPRAGRWLAEREGAPFAQLAGPIPPGEVAELSIAYVVDHDGELRIDWDAPFPMIAGAIALGDGMSLGLGAQGPPEVSPHGEEGSVRVWRFTPDRHRAGPCDVARAGGRGLSCPDLLEGLGGTPVHLEVEGLPTRSRLFRGLALVLGVAVALAIAVALVIRPRAHRRQALLRRREVLLAAIVRLGEGADPVRKDRLLGALDRVCRQLDALESAARAPG
jgi:5-hydroxyisourate hydrolase-like protein (transthyretin family)